MSLEPLRRLHASAPDPVARALAARPIPIRGEPLLRAAFPWWCGPRFRSTAAILEAARTWTPQQVTSYQLSQLRVILGRTAARTATFRRLLREAEFDGGGLGCIDDLSRLPLMDKAALRDVAREAREAQPGVPARLQRTGGTSSSPAEFDEPRDAWAFEKAFFSAWYRGRGVVPGDRMVTVSGTFGRRVVAYNPITNELNLYVKEFTNAVGDELVSRIVGFDPRMIRGYPSLLYLLASHVLKRGRTLTLPRLTAVFLSSEQILPYQVAAIEQAFQAPVSSHYGQSERIAFIQQCTRGPLLHVAELYSYVEFLKEDGSLATDDGDLAMIVGSSFANTVTPLIRYKTDDWVLVAAGDRCPDCRRHVRSVKSIEGRTGDFIVSPSGRRWSPTVLEFAIRNARHLREICLVQSDLSSVDVLVVPDDGYAADDGQSFVHELEKRIGEPTMSFRLVETSNIPRPRSQKQRFVVSKIAGESARLGVTQGGHGE